MIYHQELNSLGGYTFNIKAYNNIDLPLHFHQNFELIHTVEGAVEITVDGKTKLLSPGGMALVLSNQIHSFHTPDKSVVWICVFAESFIPYFAQKAKGKSGTDFSFGCNKVAMDFLNENLFIYTNSFLNKYDISISMLAACFNLVCSQFEKNVSLIERITLPTDLPARLLAFISEHYTEKISLSDVSLRLGYEYHYLSRCFNSCFGMSFRKCLNRYRLNHAKELLVSTEAEISEIALESGFQSIRSFNDEFVNDMGKSPRAFREEMRRK